MPDNFTVTSPRDGVHRSGITALAFGALGVVFGDIGTSPLYALQTVFSLDDGIVQATPEDVYGVISMVFWSITLIVCVKYVMFILRADNHGEGGVLALAALTRSAVRPGGRRFAVVMVLGVIGASLFYGDSVITPAISVMSAIEGVSVSAPELSHYVIPLGAVIITILFAVQRRGTHAVGRLFGPVMLGWFLCLAVLGVRQIILDPEILTALLPSCAVTFFFAHPHIAFVAMGAVVLSITGAEALYADMGHFGRRPITRAWFWLVFPCLTLNYLGQGSLILQHPEAAASPFYNLAPSWAQLPLVALATMATVIASQSVISGAYSVSRQAERLGFLPRLTVRHTSQQEGGQIYVPSINWILYAGVMILLVLFQSSEHLATAYGLAVTGTLMLTTALFLGFAQAHWKWPMWALWTAALAVGIPEGTFFAANLTKITHGGWLPLLIALLVATVMLTWERGRLIVTQRRGDLEGSFSEFVDWLHAEHPTRVPGTAVFLHPSTTTAPLALRENASFNHVMHERIFIVSTLPVDVPYVSDTDRVRVVAEDEEDRITHLSLSFGFQDDQDVPRALRVAHAQGIDIDPDTAYYFLSRITVHNGDDHSLSRWRKRLFIGLTHNAASPTEYFRLPESRTVVMGTQVRI